MDDPAPTATRMPLWQVMIGLGVLALFIGAVLVNDERATVEPDYFMSGVTLGLGALLVLVGVILHGSERR